MGISKDDKRAERAKAVPKRRILRGPKRRPPEEPTVQPDSPPANVEINDGGGEAAEPDVGFVPVEERGGAISLTEGEAGPVGEIAMLALSIAEREKEEPKRLGDSEATERSE